MITKIIEIPNSSIFLYLTENNGVFMHLLDLMDEKSDQFFNEFFSIYKPLSNDSKALFAVTFFMKNLHVHYMEKSYGYLRQRTPDRHKALNLVEMLMLLVTSKKDNAVKLFNTKTEVNGERVSFSTILNLMLADPMEKLQDCAANIISVMTESLITDRASHIGLLNSYLVPEMAVCIQKTQPEALNWKYYYAFIKLLSLCIDRENSAGSYNSYLVTNLVNYQILGAMPGVYARFKLHKSFTINFLQFTVALLALQEEQIVAQLLAHGFIDILWAAFEANCRKANIISSVCLKAFADLERQKSPAYLDYFVEHCALAAERAESARAPGVTRLLQRYAAARAPVMAPGPVDGQFSAASSLKDASDDNDSSRGPRSRSDFAVLSSPGQVVQDMDAILLDEDKENSHPGSAGLGSIPTDLESPPDGDTMLLGKREPLLPETIN